MKVLVTGSAGFIGSALCLRLLERALAEARRIEAAEKAVAAAKGGA